MKNQTLLALALAAVALAGCGKPAPSHTVLDLIKDKPLRQEIRAQCSKEPTTAASNPDCINADAAFRFRSMNSKLAKCFTNEAQDDKCIDAWWLSLGKE